jgi:hypothetical protein
VIGRRGLRSWLLMAIPLGIAGCAVGRIVAGAPSGSASAPAGTLLARRCGGCHEIPDPTRMTAAAWSSALGRMKQRIHLPESEWDSLAALGRSEARR